MTSTTRGPLPPAVYWRRRVFVLGVVAALLLIAVNLVRGNDGTAGAGASAADQATIVSSEPTAPVTTPVTTPGADDTATTDGSAGKNRGTGKGTGKGPGKGAADDPSPTEPVYTPPPAPVLVDPVGSCADDDIAVSPYVVGAVAGSTVTITLQLQTISAEACTWRISANHLALKITSADGEVWASRECPGKVPTGSVVVRRAVTSTFDLTWNSRASEAGCPRLTEFAQPGDYDVEAAAYGGEPAGASFTLAAPSTVTPGPQVVDPPSTRTTTNSTKQDDGTKSD